MKTFRLTSRAGACMHCGYVTAQACEGCQHFVCVNDEVTHDEMPDHEKIEATWPGG